MLNKIIENLEKYVVSDGISVRYELSEDDKGYYFYFPSFSYENKTVKIAISMQAKPIASISKICQIELQRGWSIPFYLWIETDKRSIRLDVKDAQDQERMGNIAKRLGSIFKITFVSLLDMDKPSSGSYNIDLNQSNIEDKATVDCANDEKEKNNNWIEESLKEELAYIAAHIEQMEHKKRNENIIMNKLKEIFPELDEDQLSRLEKFLIINNKLDSIPVETQLQEVINTWMMIKEKCPTADYNDRYVLRSFMKCLDLKFLERRRIT